LYHQITEVSHTIQGLAKDLRVTTVGLSQVNRRTSSGADKLQKEGLMGGSSLENDAEQVVLLSKPERMYDGFQSEVRIDKNRHGPVAEWKMKLDPRTLQMSEAG
jgi:replicative DNA helicase